MASNPYKVKSKQNKDATWYLTESHVNCPNSSVHAGYYSCLQLVMSTMYEIYPDVLESCFNDWADQNKTFNFHTDLIQRYESRRRKDILQRDKRNKLKDAVTTLKKLKDFRIKADYKESLYSIDDIRNTFVPKLEDFHKKINSI